MKKNIKIYFAGKVAKDSMLGPAWRDELTIFFSKKLGIEVANLDPNKTPLNFNENDPKLVVGRDVNLIKNSDVVIVYLSDDISVGGSQEMLVAKYFKKPLIGIANYGGKFNKAEKEIGGVVYKKWKDPFVSLSCDFLVKNISEALISLKKIISSKKKYKDLTILSLSADYYRKHKLYNKDKLLLNTK